MTIYCDLCMRYNYICDDIHLSESTQIYVYMLIYNTVSIYKLNILCCYIYIFTQALTVDDLFLTY